MFYLHYRLRKGFEDSSRYKEKLAVTDKSRPQGVLIWFHAGDIESLNAIIAIIGRFNKDFPSYNYLVTTKTLPSFAILRKSGLANVVHQYYPFDTYNIAKKFVKHWAPNLAIFSTLSLDFNILNTLKTNHCNIALINVSTDKNHLIKLWICKSLFTRYFDFFATIIPRTQLDYHNIQQFISENVYYVGNIKNTLPPMLYDKNMLHLLKQKIGNRPVLLFANTHRREEEFGIVTKIALNQHVKKSLLIICPRQIKRVKEIEKIAQKHNMKYAIHSKDYYTLGDEIDLYIVDTTGDLGLFYSIADCTFIGGSLVKHGGHNMLEAAKFCCAIITGPYTFRFTEVVQNLISSNALIIVKNQDELIEVCKTLMTNQELMEEMQENAKMMYKRQSIILTQIMLYINTMIQDG